MDIKNYFPIWDKLTHTQKELLTQYAIPRKFPKGSVLHNGTICTGVIIVKSGRIRGFTVSEDGREITLYRLFDRDICMLSASCMVNSLEFEITLSADIDTEVYVISPDIYKGIMEESAPLAIYTNEIMASRFSEVMWLIDTILWKSFDKRLAEFLLNESSIENSSTLKITHEVIGNHLGHPREVVTRMLKYFANEGFIKLSRGSVEIIDADGLSNLIE